MSVLSFDPLRRTAAVTGAGRVVRLREEDEAVLAGTETLIIPAEVEFCLDVNRLPALRTVRYGGSADVFGFAEGLSWLAEKAGDPDALMARLATDMLAAPAISATLTAIAAPRLPPIQSIPGWRELLDAIDDLAMCSNGRQDSSRQNICLCRSYSQLKRLEYAFAMGRAVEDRPPRPEESDPSGARFSPEEQFLYALALVQGHSYQAFYTADGPCGYCNLRTWKAYMAYLRPRLVWADTAEFQLGLGRLLDAGLLTAGNFSAAVELLTAHRLAAATAWLLDQAGRRGWSGTQGRRPREEFQL